MIFTLLITLTSLSTFADTGYNRELKTKLKIQKRNHRHLKEVHPKLRSIIEESVRRLNFIVTDGHRGKKEQNDAFRKGFSKLKFPQSAHNSKLARAVDVVPYPVVWNNYKKWNQLAKVVKKVAKEKGVKIIWGGDWKRFKDYPHFELHRSER